MRPEVDHGGIKRTCAEIFGQETFAESLAEHVVLKTEQEFLVSMQGDAYIYHAQLIRRRLHISAFLKIPGFSGRAPLRGTDLYDEMMNHFGMKNIDAIVAVWSGHTTNFEQFMELTSQGFSEEEAALNTWSGRQARRYGFHQVHQIERKSYGDEPEEQMIRLEFRRPD